MRLADPVLLRPARLPLVGVVTLTVVQGVLVIAQAFAVAHLVVALVDGERVSRQPALLLQQRAPGG